MRSRNAPRSPLSRRKSSTLIISAFVSGNHPSLPLCLSVINPLLGHLHQMHPFFWSKPRAGIFAYRAGSDDARELWEVAVFHCMIQHLTNQRAVFVQCAVGGWCPVLGFVCAPPRIELSPQRRRDRGDALLAPKIFDRTPL